MVLKGWGLQGWSKEGDMRQESNPRGELDGEWECVPRIWTPHLRWVLFVQQGGLESGSEVEFSGMMSLRFGQSRPAGQGRSVHPGQE